MPTRSAFGKRGIVDVRVIVRSALRSVDPCALGPQRGFDQIEHVAEAWPGDGDPEVMDDVVVVDLVRRGDADVGIGIG